eukprot:TRINITY_DN382_c0_g1_i2.p1 TRINITY_DN382_c0_g1~~TRINITY_DN382_c0_g1_i2.p1  ORF type:complete len:111 (+),score=26.23 TRINITY_DN382_c0_g1_i2:64-396(+)
MSIFKHGPQKLLFPNQIFKLIPRTAEQKTTQVHFEVPLYFTKPEIKTYLERIYNLKVKNVRTVIHEGNLFRPLGAGKLQKRVFAKNPDKKKAIVDLFDEVALENRNVETK